GAGRFMLLFVFSGRRRNRVWVSDGSPEVSSSDRATARAAMRWGAHDDAAYLAVWRRGTPADCPDDLEAAASAAAARLEAEYDERSEARRVGEEGGAGGWGEDERTE